MKLIVMGAISMALFFASCGFDQKSAPVESQVDLEARFLQPPSEARPQAWWWWLKTPTNQAAITRDLEEMKAKGLSGCLILDGGVGPFGPHKWKKKTIVGETEIRYEETDEYKDGSLSQPEESMITWSKEWRDLVRFASLEAGRLGLDLGVFIGPAGCAAPWVPPAYGQQEIVWNKTLIRGGNTVNLNLEQPHKKKDTNNPSQKIAATAHLSLYQDITILAVPSKLTLQLDEIINVSDQLDSTGNFKWLAPEGEWNIYRFGYRPTGRNLDGVFYIDHLSKEAFDKHWEHTVALLLNEMRPEERKAFKYVECDSWEAGDPNWTSSFPQEFLERRGYKLLNYLPILAGETIGTKEKSDQFKNDYRLTISDLIAENHYARQQEVAHAHDLHSYAEACGPHQFQSDLLKCASFCDVAMGEFWVPSPHRPTPPARFLVREAANAAHIYGKKRVFAESFTSVGPNWEQSPFSMKASADQAFCDGLNWICFHTFSHRPSLTEVPGLTHSAGTHFDRTLTWWEQSASFVDYLSRCSMMLQQGLFVADVLFYKGNGIRRNGMNQHLNGMVWEDGLKNPPAALGKGYDYDKCNEEVLLSRISVKDGWLVLPDGMKYRILALDNRSPVSLKALQKLVELAEDGATIVGDPPIPYLSITDHGQAYQEILQRIWGHPEDGEKRMGKGRVIWDLTIREVLQQNKLLPDFECSGVSDKGTIDYIHRRSQTADIYFVSSRWQPIEQVECTFRVSGKQPELWNPVTGELKKLTRFTQENGRTTIPLKFDPCGSFFIVFRDPVTANDDTQNWTSYQAVKELKGPWKVHFDKDWGAPEHAVFEQLSDWTEHPQQGIKYYSGKATYHLSFDLPEASSKKAAEFFLDLGQVHELAEVRLNGENLGVLWTKPFCVDISAALKSQGNHLEIDVINLWPNRLIGDAFLPEQKRYTQTNIRKFTQASQLLPSGLLGPVQIKVSE